MPPFYWGTPNIAERYVPTLSSATASATRSTLVLPATDTGRTVWLSAPTPDVVDTLARNNIPEGFSLNNLEAIEIGTSPTSVAHHADTLMIWVYTTVSVGAAVLAIVIVCKVARMYMRRMHGETDPEKADTPVSITSGTGEDASTQAQGAGIGNICQPTRSSPPRITICNVPDAESLGVPTAKTDEPLSASVVEVEEKVNVVEEEKLDPDVAKAIIAPLPDQTGEEVDNLALDPDLVIASNIASPVQSEEEAQDLDQDPDVVMAVNIRLPSQSEEEVDDLSLDPDVVFASYVALSLQSEEEADNLSLDPDVVFASYIAISAQNGDEVESLEMDVDVGIAICFSLPALSSDEENWINGPLSGLDTDVTKHQTQSECTQVNNTTQLVVRKRGRAMTMSKPRTPPTPLKTFMPEFEIDNAVRTVERNQGTMPALSTSEDVKNEKENSYGRTSEENEKTPISANALQGIFSMLEDEGFVPAKDDLTRPIPRIAGAEPTSLSSSPSKVTRRRGPRPALANITNWGEQVEQRSNETKENQDNLDNATIVKERKKGRRGRGMSMSTQRPAIAKHQIEEDKKEEIQEERADTFLGDLARTIGATAEDNEGALLKKLRSHVLSLAESGSNVDFAEIAKTMAEEQGPEHDLRLPNTTMMYINTDPSIVYDPGRDYWEPVLSEPGHRTKMPIKSCLRLRHQLVAADNDGGRKKVNIAGLEAIQVAKDNYYAVSVNEVEGVMEPELELETSVVVEVPKVPEDREAQGDQAIQEAEEVLEVAQETQSLGRINDVQEIQVLQVVTEAPEVSQEIEEVQNITEVQETTRPGEVQEVQETQETQETQEIQLAQETKEEELPSVYVADLLSDSHDVVVEDTNEVHLGEEQIVSPPVTTTVIDTSPALSVITVEPNPPISPVPHAFPFEDPAPKRLSLSRLNRKQTSSLSSKSSRKLEKASLDPTIQKPKRKIISNGLMKLGLKRSSKPGGSPLHLLDVPPEPVVIVTAPGIEFPTYLVAKPNNEIAPQIDKGKDSGSTSSDGPELIAGSCSGSTSYSVPEAIPPGSSPTSLKTKKRFFSAPTFSVFGINTHNAKASDIASSPQNSTEMTKEKSKLRRAFNSVLNHTQMHLAPKSEAATRVVN